MLDGKSSTRDVQVKFANHNFTFSNFYNTHKNLCFSLAEEKSLVRVGKKISAFVYEFSYSIPIEADRKRYWMQIREIQEEVLGDRELSKMLLSNNIHVNLEIRYYRKFYSYYLRYLELLGRFVEDLSTTLMPNTNIQTRFLSFVNTQIFFEKIIEYKRELLEQMGEFNIISFMNPVNKTITLYYAYILFVNKDVRKDFEANISLVLSILLNKQILRLFEKVDNLGNSDKAYIKKLDNIIHSKLLYSISIINESFSDYGINPKIQKKKRDDLTLI